MRLFISDPADGLVRVASSNLSYRLSDQYVEVEAQVKGSTGWGLVLYYNVGGDSMATIVAALDGVPEVVSHLRSFDELSALGTLCPALVGLLVNGIVHDRELPRLVRDSDPDDGSQGWWIVFPVPDASFSPPDPGTVDDLLWDKRIQVASKVVSDLAISVLHESDLSRLTSTSAAWTLVKKGAIEGARRGTVIGGTLVLRDFSDDLFPAVFEGPFEHLLERLRERRPEQEELAFEELRAAWHDPLVSDLFDVNSHPDLSAAMDRARQRRATEAARREDVERRAQEMESLEARRRAPFDAVVRPFFRGISGIADSPHELAGYWCLHHEVEPAGVNLLQGLAGSLQFGPKGAGLAERYYEHHVELLLDWGEDDDVPWEFACAKVVNTSEGGLTLTQSDVEPLSLDGLRCSHNRPVHCTDVESLADALAEILSFHDREFA